jgi:hypothetical protein
MNSFFKEPTNIMTSKRKSASRVSYNLPQYQPHNVLWQFNISEEHIQERGKDPFLNRKPYEYNKRLENIRDRNVQQTCVKVIKPRADACQVPI